MLRNDVAWLIPALVIALVQVKIVWPTPSQYSQSPPELDTPYKKIDQLRMDYFIHLAYFLLLFQLAFPIFKITETVIVLFLIRASGYFLVISGFFLSFWALKALGANWSPMNNCQIKKWQTLVTSGPYKIVRHPIYFSVMMEIAGFELVANSWLAVIFFIISFIFIYRHILLEEKMLEAKFRDEYLSYKKKTKMLIPFVF